MTHAGGLHVVFGSGAVGLALADELLARGRRVRVVSRGGRAGLPDGAEVRAAREAIPATVRWFRDHPR